MDNERLVLTLNPDKPAVIEKHRLQLELPKTTLTAIDEVVARREFGGRSELIRHAVEHYLRCERWRQEGESMSRHKTDDSYQDYIPPGLI